jgi:hypothetical protein
MSPSTRSSAVVEVGENEEKRKEDQGKRRDCRKSQRPEAHCSTRGHAESVAGRSERPQHPFLGAERGRDPRPGISLPDERGLNEGAPR